MTAPRTYALGLPVFVTVHDDGTVTYDIDVSEADNAPAEFEPDYMFMYDAGGQLTDRGHRDARACRRRAHPRIAGATRLDKDTRPLTPT